MDLDSERKFLSQKGILRGAKYLEVLHQIYYHIVLLVNLMQIIRNSIKQNWLDNFFKEIKPEESKNLALLHKSYPWYSFRNKETLYENQEYIRSKLKPNYAIKLYF